MRKYFPRKGYHRIDFTVRMKLLGLGSPGQVPLLSERKAIELGAELISEFFVLGTAIAAILLEYLRQSKNKKHKDIRMSTDIENLHDRNELVLTDIEENLKLVNDLKKSINEQKSELGKINGRMETVEDKLNTKMNIASSQTSKEKAIGKVLYSSNSNINPNADVQNSMIYQIAHEAVKSLIH